MKRLPAPLTPADCVLKDFAFMPLEVARLRRSKLWLIARRRPEVGFYAVNLWAACWHETPCASLEDDDDVLADAAMCSPDRWPDVRADVMRGWVKCADQRLYHKTVSEKAIESWIGKIEQRWSKECGRLRKAKQPQISLSDYVAVFYPITARFKPDIFPRNSGGKSRNSGGSTEEIPRTGAGIPAENALKGQGQGQGQGQGESKISGANAPSPADAGGEGTLPLELTPSTRDNGFAAVWLLWPQKGRSSKREAQGDWAALLKRHTPAVLKAAVEAYLRSDDATRDLARKVPALERWLKKRAEAWIEIAANPNMEQANGRAHHGHANAGRTGSKRGDMVRAALRIAADARRGEADGDGDAGQSGIQSGPAARLAPPSSSE